MFKLRPILSNAEPGQAGAGGAAPNNTTTTTTEAGPAAGAPAAGAVDVQAQISAALAQRDAEYAEQLKAATGHSDFKSLTEANLKAQGKLEELAAAREAEAQEFKGKYQQTLISNALLTEATGAVDPSDVVTHLSGRAQVDDKGNVTIDGKPVADAVKQLLADKPHWAKAEGGAGSGAPSATTVPDAEKNKQDYLAAAKNKDVMGMLNLNTGAK